MAGIDRTPGPPLDGMLSAAELATQLSATRARERHLLAEAIHDDPMQLIVAAMLQIDLLRMTPSHGGDEEWEKVIVMLETSVERLRRLIDAISPPDLSDGLCRALQDLAVGIFMGTPTRVQVSETSEVSLPAATRAAAYRIFREALVNARQHAAAAAVELTLESAADRTVLTLTDNGVGGADLAPGDHLGLHTMHTLAHQIGGRLTVLSPVGGGTAVTLTL